MNKSVDERLLPQGEYIDGLNIRAGSTEDSEIGAIENSKGNELLTNIPDGITTLEYNGTPLDESNGAMCIGAYEDGANETIYFFVTSEIADIIASWTVGEDGVSGGIRYHVISTSVLNFSKENRIVGIDKVDDLLFFTDNLNPPRKINVTRPYGEPENDVDLITEEDLSVIVKPPLNAPTISTFNSERRGNYLEDKIITFSYRWRYQDGEYSALSPFSEAAFSPIGFRLDFDGLFNAGMKNRMNNAVVEVETGNDRVKEIQICFKRSGDNSVYVIDNYDKEGLDIDSDSTFNINFDNSKIYTVLPQEELFRLYDNVPKKAKAQTIMGNRVMYGNYVDGHNMQVTEGGREVEVDFDASLISSEVFTKSVDTETFNSSAYDIDPANTGYSVTDAGVRVDFTNFLSSNELSKGSVVTFTFNISHDSYTTSGTAPTDFQDSFNISSSIVLSQDYASANDLMGSPEFAAFIGTTNNIKPIADADEGGTLTDLFNANVSTSALPGGYSKAGSGLTAIGQGFEYSLYTTNTPSILCNAMKYTHATDPDIYEYFSFNIASVDVTSPEGFESLHSNRNYSLGIVYLDEQGRQSTVFTSQNNGVYTRARNSVNKNQVRLQINSQPPYWATAYRPVIKPTYGTYETIYSITVFEDSTFAYFLLDGENARKVNEGDKLIVKSDESGALDKLVETTVLDVSTQEANFLIPNDAGSEGVVQPAGVYMKLKPTNFTVNANISEDNEDLFFLGASGKIDGLITQQNSEGSNIRGRALGATLITEEVGGTHVPVAIPAGTKVILSYEVGWNQGIVSGCSLQATGAEFIAQADYADFREMVDAQNINLSEPGTYVNQGSIYPCYSASQDTTLYTSTDTVMTAAGSNPDRGQHQFDFVKDSNSGAIALRLISGAEITGTDLVGKNISDAGIAITYQFSSVSETDSGAFVFETKPVATDNEIYFESSETLLIQDGEHQGNEQNQFGGAPAISTLDFFDCYTFGNGVESYKIEDLIAGDPLLIGQRTTSVSEQDYKEAHRFASITYSGVYNAETNLNKLNQFNLSLANYSDLEKSFGKIGILHARETDLLVLQEDRVSYVLQGKNLLSDSIGGGAVTSVPEVLGTQIARNEEYGISSDAETFAHFGNEVFFTDSKRGAVLSLIGGSYKQDKLIPISELGMRSYFRDTFIESFRSYKLGGFDPYMNEYVLTINEDEQDVVTPIIEEVECSPDNEFTTELISQDTYEVQFDPFIGTVEIDYTVQSINETIMQVVWDDTQVVNSVISGTGSVSFSKTKNYPDTATVTISCPGLDVQPCNEGMDVLFLVDYSSLAGSTWMPEHIQTLKNDMSGIISTIEQQSGGDYRLGLVTYESVDNSDVPSASGSVTDVGATNRLIDSTANFLSDGIVNGDFAAYLNAFNPLEVTSVFLSGTELQLDASNAFNKVGVPYAVGSQVSDTSSWPRYTVQGDYHYLPSGQKYINEASSYTQYVTCFEKFSSGNKDSFNRYLRSIGTKPSQHLSGNPTSISANKLIDSAATFVTDGIRPGDVIYKYAAWSGSDVSATVVSVDSETQLTLDADIFTSVTMPWTYGTQEGTEAIRGFTPIQYKSQPSGIALSRIIEQNLAGAFRSNVNKQIILYTNTKPGGENAYHLEADADEFRRLASICNDLGIVLNIVGPDENPNVPDTWNVYNDAVSITNGVRVNSFASGSVLSAIESTCGAERTIPSYRCDQNITSLSLSSISTYTYNLDLGTTTGSAFINSSSVSPVSISAEYNGTTYTGGPGVSVQVEISVKQEDPSSIATVTVTSETNQTGVNITHTCPVLPPERKVYMVVVNDANQSGETITNRYNVGTNNPTNDSTLNTVFSDSGVSNDTSVTGFTDGSNSIIPLNGDTVTVTSIKSPTQTGDFNPCNSIGYYVGPEQDLTPEVLLNKATFEDVTSTTAADGTETNEITFPVTSQDEGENPDAIYLIWNYRDNLPNVLQEIDLQGITQGGNIDIPLINSSTVTNVTYPVTILITPSPSHGTVTKTNGDPIPSGGFVATNESEAVVKYTQDGSANLIDTFGYTISSGGTCSASNVVNTESIAITENSYLYFNFDQSGSMIGEEIILRELVTSGKLKQALLPFYNNDSNEYDKKVYVYPGTNYQIYSNYKFLDKSDPSAVTVQLVNRTVNQYPRLGSDRQFAGGFVGDPQEILTSVKIGGFLYSNIQTQQNTNAIIGKVTSIQYGEYGIFTVDTTVTEAEPEALDRTGSSGPYDQLVYIENLQGDSPNNQYGFTRQWRNERTWLVLQDHKQDRLLNDVRYIGRENEGSPYFDTYVLPASGFERADWTPLLGTEQGALPSDKPDNVVMFVFQDEASETIAVDFNGNGTSSSEPPYGVADYPYYTLSRYNPTFFDSRANSPNHSGDIKNLRRRVELLNENNPNFYKAAIFYMRPADGREPTSDDKMFREYLKAVQNGTGIYSGDNGLSDLSSVFNFDYDTSKAKIGERRDAKFRIEKYFLEAPLVPSEYSSFDGQRFSGWDDYYLFKITKSLLDLGFSNPGGWPVVN